MNIREARKKIMKFYGGFGWSSLFTYIRLFITAPFEHLEPLVPTEGLIVDLGCGYGIFANLLGLMSAKRRILGIDLNDYKIKRADKGLSNVKFLLGDITKTELSLADCILLIHVLHHLESYEEQELLLAACREKLKNGGKLIIAEIDRRPWWKFILTRLADRILYNFRKPYYPFPERLLPLLDKLGFKNETDSTHHRGTPFSHITYICTKQ